MRAARSPVGGVLALTSARVSVLVSVLVLALTLAGCSTGAGRVSDPPADRTAYPVVAVGQAGSVLDAVQTALAHGVRTTDTPATADARLHGPTLQLALAEAKVAARRKKPALTPSRPTNLRLIVPAQLGWPRFFVAVGNSNQSSTPVLRVLTSDSARSPYGLWAQTTMLPGATLPETAPETIGSAPLAADATGLIASPAEVLSEFAGYLNAGTGTTPGTTTSAKFRRLFQRSIYSDQLNQVLSDERRKLKSVATLTSTHTVGPAVPMAVRTSDGGALVIGELVQTSVLKVKKGKGQVNLTDQDLAALAGGTKQIKKSFIRTAVEVLVFTVPPRGKGLIAVIAAQKGDVRAVIK